MACIISRNSKKLFVSYAPGTGSSSLEQHLRTYDHLLRADGFDVLHYPLEEFGENGEISRHICYYDYLMSVGNSCDYVATGIRNPFSYYFAEYNRILTKWCKLLDDKNSWIYNDGSRSTLELTLKAKNSDCFDSWFFEILTDSVDKGYLFINEDHLNRATHFIKTEDMTNSLDMISREIFSRSFSEIMGPVPIVNASNYSGNYYSNISEKTKTLALSLFAYYMNKFGYNF